MFGVGWTEMLLIGIVALVVIGPKDLPVLMNRLGKAVATIRRMGNEFQRELNKTTGLEQITDLRRSITEPLKQTAAEITREFNKPLPSGAVEPTGVVTPTDPEVEDVTEAIKEKIGMSPAPTAPLVPPAAAVAATTATVAAATPSPVATPVATPIPEHKPMESPAPIEAIAPPAKPRKPRARKTPAPAEAPLLETATAPAGSESAATEGEAPAKPARKRRAPAKKTES